LKRKVINTWFPTTTIATKYNSLLFVFTTVLLLFHAELPLLLFKTFEVKYKKEIKQIIKAGVPEKDLVEFTFHKSVIRKVSHDFRWIKKNEFRFKNEMYDVVKIEVQGDSVHYKCIHDLKESKLFVNLDKYLIDLIKSDSAKRNEFVSFLNSLNTFYLPVKPFLVNNKSTSNDEMSGIIPQKLNDGFTHILTPPPRT
jgi:hypothetical protein